MTGKLILVSKPTLTQVHHGIRCKASIQILTIRERWSDNGLYILLKRLTLPERAGRF